MSDPREELLPNDDSEQLTRKELSAREIMLWTTPDVIRGVLANNIERIEKFYQNPQEKTLNLEAEPFRYVGVYFTDESLTTTQHYELLAKIVSRVGGWIISQGDKFTLVVEDTPAVVAELSQFLQADVPSWYQENKKDRPPDFPIYISVGQRQERNPHPGSLAELQRGHIKIIKSKNPSSHDPGETDPVLQISQHFDVTKGILFGAVAGSMMQELVDQKLFSLRPNQLPLFVQETSSSKDEFSNADYSYADQLVSINSLKDAVPSGRRHLLNKLQGLEIRVISRTTSWKELNPEGVREERKQRTAQSNKALRNSRFLPQIEAGTYLSLETVRKRSPF